jgi:hypothetical protein
MWNKIVAIYNKAVVQLFINAFLTTLVYDLANSMTAEVPVTTTENVAVAGATLLANFTYLQVKKAKAKKNEQNKQ